MYKYIYKVYSYIQKSLEGVISSKGWTRKRYGNKAGMKKQKRLPYYRIMVEKKDEKTTRHVLVSSCLPFAPLLCTMVVVLCLFIPAFFHAFYRFVCS